VLDHYASFLHGLETDVIDYDARMRAAARSRPSATRGMRRMLEVAEGLDAVPLAELDRRVLVREDAAEGSGLED
jgi:hypothetical protein